MKRLLRISNVESNISLNFKNKIFTNNNEYRIEAQVLVIKR